MTNEIFRILNLTYHLHVLLLLQSYLILLLEYLGQVRVNLLCFLRQLHVAVMNKDEVLVLVTRGRRHLQERGTRRAGDRCAASQISPSVRADAAQCAHLAGVHGLAAARRLHHGVEALGGAEVTLGQLQLVLLLGLQSRFQVLLLPVLQELQLLCRCSEKETSTQPTGNKEGNVAESGRGIFIWSHAELRPSFTDYFLADILANLRTSSRQQKREGFHLKW